ncbi:Protein canopy like protein [Argiope bruennichi]|uniref:Protein canopy like protein n=2 Tax=Argiope bruennichi TaxID=94029 RepID=A0A8T0FIE6_ARGBR|nr:Protein canopy like protein [Argiope bruennichi]
MIKPSKYYSLILDTTPDVSHTEQLTVVIRFVYKNEETNKAQIEKYFVGFQSVDDTTGQELNNLRSDEAYEYASIVADDLGVDTDFPQSQNRLKKKLFQDEQTDEPISNPRQKFEVEFYNIILDTAISSITERFSQLKEHYNYYKNPEVLVAHFANWDRDGCMIEDTMPIIELEDNQGENITRGCLKANNMRMKVSFLSLVSVFVTFFQMSVQQSVLKCLVCKQVVHEINSAVSNEDPKKTIQVGSFRIQPDGTQKQSQIKYAGSELHLNEIMETVCNSLDDYAQAKNKDTGELALLNLSKDIEKLSTHELVQDPDLNRSLKYYCESFIEDFEDDILQVFKAAEDLPLDDVSRKLCSDSAGYCIAAHTEL